MVLTVYLIRHGKTEGDGVKRYKGSLDVPMSGIGAKQIEAASRFINNDLAVNGARLAAVYSSPLSRAVKSADIIASPHGLAPIMIDDLKERNFGEWEGMSFDEIEAAHPDAFKAWAKDPLNHSPVGGESTREVDQRASRALEEILSKHKSDCSIAITAHGGINRAILCRLLGMPLKNIFRIEQNHGCVNVVEIHDGLPVVRLVNWSGGEAG